MSMIEAGGSNGNHRQAGARASVRGTSAWAGRGMSLRIRRIALSNFRKYRDPFVLDG